MKLKNLLVISMVTMTMAACNGTQKGTNTDSTPETDTNGVASEVVTEVAENDVVVEVSENENQVTVSETQPTETVISDDLSASPRTYSVDGKSIKVVKGVTSEDDLQKQLGEPFITLASSYTYTWERDGIEYKTKFYLKSGVVTGVKETMYK